MRFVLNRMRYCWRKYEFVRAGVYVALGAVIAIRVIKLQQSEETKSHLFCPTIHAASSIPYSHLPPLPPNSNLSVVQSLGFPQFGQIRIYDGFVCSFDRRNRIPYWVMEHLYPDKVSYKIEDSNKRIERSKFEFFEDLQEHPLFRSTNEDYFRSGYDRGHMSPAGDHPYEANAMQQTFVLSNIAPQVGMGFNRDAWVDLEKYIRSIARKTNNVVVVTGPLFLARQVDKKKMVTYEVIGLNNVAVPTHFFKAVAIQQNTGGSWETRAWVMPNVELPKNVKVNQFQVPIETVERASGLKLFPNL